MHVHSMQILYRGAKVITRRRTKGYCSFENPSPHSTTLFPVSRTERLDSTREAGPRTTLRDVLPFIYFLVKNKPSNPFFLKKLLKSHLRDHLYDRFQSDTFRPIRYFLSFLKSFLLGQKCPTPTLSWTSPLSINLVDVRTAIFQTYVI